MTASDVRRSCDTAVCAVVKYPSAPQTPPATAMTPPAGAIFAGRPALSELEFGRMRFVIADSPTEKTMDKYIKELKQHKVNTLVRVCEPTYDPAKLNRAGIEVLDWVFPDGGFPETELIDKWLALLRTSFDTTSDAINGETKATRFFHHLRHSAERQISVTSNTSDCNNNAILEKTKVKDAKKDSGVQLAEDKGCAIAVHDVAGLGRAPVMVALALMEAGMGCDDAIFLIRSNRRGALNAKQVDFLRQYKSQNRLRRLRFHSVDWAKHGTSCVIQ